LEGANPNIGEVGKPEFVEEDRVEVLVSDGEDRSEIKKAIERLKKVSLKTHTQVVYHEHSRRIHTKNPHTRYISWKISKPQVQKSILYVHPFEASL